MGDDNLEEIKNDIKFGRKPVKNKIVWPEEIGTGNSVWEEWMAHNPASAGSGIQSNTGK